MKRIVILVLLCLLLSPKVFATDLGKAQADLFGASVLYRNLNGHASDLMDGFDPAVQADFGSAVNEIISGSVRQSKGYFRTSLTLLLRIIAVVILCRVVGVVGNERAVYAAGLAGTLAIAAYSASDIYSMIRLGQNTVEDVSSFTTLLIPVLASAAAASGRISAGTGVYAITSIFCDLLVRVCRVLLIPIVYGFLALGITDSALGQNKLGKLRELLGWTVKTVLKAVVYLFTGLLAVTGAISGTADAAALKATKLAISGMVPVVGGIVSDASESLLAGAGLLKSSVGTYGMLAVVSIFLLPFIRLGIFYLGFKCTAALCGVLESGQEKLLDTMTGAMGYMLAMAGCCTIIAAISCCCLIKVGTV